MESSDPENKLFCTCNSQADWNLHSVECPVFRETFKSLTKLVFVMLSALAYGFLIRDSNVLNCFVKNHKKLQAKASLQRCSRIPFTQQLSEQDCQVCFLKYSKRRDIRQLPCGHVFHKTCCEKWFRENSKCPLCRASVM